MDLQTHESYQNATSSHVGDQHEKAGGIVISKSEETEITRERDGDLRPKTDGLKVAEAAEEERKVEELKPEKKVCFIDVKASGEDESLKREKVCRICHLSLEQESQSSELIQLGCDCKDELSFSHRRCAETWFNQKGNRLCEICGKTARTIAGVEDTRIYVVELNERRMFDLISTANSPRRCSNNVCNLLLGFLVLALILPWFFRVDFL